MKMWICAKCGHEYPDEQAKLVPDRQSMYVMNTVGILAIIAGIAMAVAYFLVVRRIELIIFGPLIALMSIPLFSFGKQCAKGIKTQCPACSKAAGFPLDTRNGKYIQTQFAKKKV